MALLIETDIVCPHCGEAFPTMIDSSQRSYSTTEDCAVCCRPIQLEVTCEPGEVFDVRASAEMS
jgi:hypothetical protein